MRRGRASPRTGHEPNAFCGYSCFIVPKASSLSNWSLRCTCFSMSPALPPRMESVWHSAGLGRFSMVEPFSCHARWVRFPKPRAKGAAPPPQQQGADACLDGQHHLGRVLQHVHRGLHRRPDGANSAERIPDGVTKSRPWRSTLQTVHLFPPRKRAADDKIERETQSCSWPGAAFGCALVAVHFLGCHVCFSVASFGDVPSGMGLGMC